MSWAALFDRAATYAVTEAQIRDRLAERRTTSDSAGVDDP